MESSSPIRSKKPVLESNTINAVPESARHGSPSSQFTLWLSANLQITAVVDGALAIIFGSEAMSAIIGLLIGNIIGGAVMALHSSQGAKLGLPQMISSRIRFGVKGAALPLLMVIIMYLDLPRRVQYYPVRRLTGYLVSNRHRPELLFSAC